MQRCHRCVRSASPVLPAALRWTSEPIRSRLLGFPSRLLPIPGRRRGVAQSRLLLRKSLARPTSELLEVLVGGRRRCNCCLEVRGQKPIRRSSSRPSRMTSRGRGGGGRGCRGEVQRREAEEEWVRGQAATTGAGPADTAAAPQWPTSRWLLGRCLFSSCGRVERWFRLASATAIDASIVLQRSRTSWHAGDSRVRDT